MMNSKYALGAILVLIIGGGGLYLYADSEGTNAINEVADSMEFLDSRVSNFNLLGLSVDYIYTYRLENPSKYDVLFEYYVEIYYQDTYVATMEFVEMVPAGRSITVDIECHVGSEAVGIVTGLINPTYRYEGDFKASTTILYIPIAKSWSNEWEYTP